eukprot:TRINITY_DN18451_c1_g3_i1.p1 TRINITY_DN18451_c1_g3~~TRINITY_DN18451_c1_g3_i1.p1  ORF type:complete len:1466 (+),score=323.52 TRINITY_DN18451_c1_g3_i1:52-4449(+)
MDLPPQLRRLPNSDLLPIRDGLESLIQAGFADIANLEELQQKILEKLKGVTVPSAADEELPEPPENLAEIVLGQNPDLPFVRTDHSAVPKAVEAGCEVYLRFAGGSYLVGEGDVVEEMDPETCCFVVERLDGGGENVTDGIDVLFKHVATEKYMTCRSDSGPLTFEDRDVESQSQEFCLYKQNRPKALKHKNIIYLRSWLGNYVALEQEGGQATARRWLRGEKQEITLLKKAVVEAKTTEMARKMQFQAFDIDGNGNITKPELQTILYAIGKEACLDDAMAALDPDGNGKIDLACFKDWADGGAFDEAALQHAEVLGNFAQRCSDALFLEKALNEILALVPSSMMQDVVECYQSLFGRDLREDIGEKGKKDDGWIFSSYWGVALQALVEPEADLWARALNDAMRGLGTDEGTLTALVCTMPQRLRAQICDTYLKKYDKTLVDHIKSETSFSYKKVLVLQVLSPAECKARMLNQAMVGLGTDEGQLIRVLCMCDFGERRAVKDTYMQMYQKDLIEHIKSETSGNFKKALVCMLQAEEAEFDLETDCETMKKAMDGWGTDEAALINVICARTPKQMEDINAKFQELYDKSLFTRVKSETSGHFQSTLLGCIRHPMEQLAHSVRECIKGWGTDDSGLICCLVHLEEFKREALAKEYTKLFGRELWKDVKNDTSGSYQKALLSLIKPAPEVWAEALTGAMKGLGTSDELLINFIAIAKDNMGEVREAFAKKNGKSLAEWIEGDCSGEYKKTLVAVAKRNGEDVVEMLPVYWAQRLRDCLNNIGTLQDVLVSMPSVAIKRGTQMFEDVYGKSLRDQITEVCDEQKSWFSFSNNWKVAMLRLMDMPVEMCVKGLNDAMAGFGTDEGSLTTFLMTMPANLTKDIHMMYENNYGRSLVDHIECETSSSYKKALVYQALSWAQSRAKALNGAMEGMGTSEDQLIRVICNSSLKERAQIREAYENMYGRDLVEHIQSETSGSFQNILVSVLECTSYRESVDYTADCKKLKQAMDGFGTDEKAIIEVVASKSPQQVEYLRERWQVMYGVPSLYDRINSETSDWGTSIFTGDSFRQAILSLLRPPAQRLAFAVRDCMKGWGTDETGLVTLLTHLSEKQRKELVDTYATIDGGGDLVEHIKGDTSGDFEQALLALVRPAPQTWAYAMDGAMRGLGTSDNLLINMMVLAKDRMDEVRSFFEEKNGKTLAEWIEGDCSGDYKDTLVKLANRKCIKFCGVETGLTVPAPPSRKSALERFNKVFNELCQKKKASPDEDLRIPEQAQQEMASAFQYYGAPERSSSSPNLDRVGLWNLTNDCGFPPGDDTDDLDATFREWDVSGTGDISWNDFVREMTTRVNDPNHYEADPLPESYDDFDEEWKVPSDSNRPKGLDDEYEDEGNNPPAEVEINGVMVPSAIALDFVAALRTEYVDGGGAAVGDFFDSGKASDEMIGAFDPIEGEVREADDKGAKVDELVASWGL